MIKPYIKTFSQCLSLAQNSLISILFPGQLDSSSIKYMPGMNLYPAYPCIYPEMHIIIQSVYVYGYVVTQATIISFNSKYSKNGCQIMLHSACCPYIFRIYSFIHTQPMSDNCHACLAMSANIFDRYHKNSLLCLLYSKLFISGLFWYRF